MVNSIWKMVAVAALMAIAGILIGRPERSEAAPERIVANQPTGRFQIVNGTPALSKNIMLLDTWTGESWVSCEDADKDTHWCLIFGGTRSSSPSK